MRGCSAGYAHLALIVAERLPANQVCAGKSRHDYASHWPNIEPHRPASELTDLGIRYLQAAGPEKEALNLELLRAFHTYLYKYLDMIVRGHLPRYGNKVNEDVRKLLTMMLPAGTAISG